MDTINYTYFSTDESKRLRLAYLSLHVDAMWDFWQRLSHYSLHSTFTCPHTGELASFFRLHVEGF